MSHLVHIYLTGKPYTSRGSGTFAYPADSYCSGSVKQVIYLGPSIAAAVEPVSRNLVLRMLKMNQPSGKAYQH